tara:strand:- start:7814 stop:10513 length:2700 start_codon:yes stop_codon:yes gene_type:complete
MKKLIQVCAAALVLMLPILVQAQDTVSIRDLNTYDNLTEYSQAAVEAHPLKNQTVIYTAVIVSNPRSSGLSTPSDTDNDGVIDRISRMHVFITDTAAVNQGRDGMSIQLVEEDFGLLAGLNRGDVVTFKGRLTFFNAVAQMKVDEAPTIIGSVYLNYPQLEVLLTPWDVTVDELMTANNDGTYQINIANYPKYNGAYVKLSSATVSNVTIADRPNWALNENGSRIYAYDTSLRYRNDRTSGYLPGWNYRRLDGLEGGEDGLFVPPTPGAIVDVSGFMLLDGFSNDGHIAANQVAFKIAPMEDGVLWATDDDSGDDIRCVDGELCNGETLSWPSDLTIIGLPPVVSNVALSDSMPTSSSEVVVTADADAEGDATVANVKIVYTSGDSTLTATMTNTGGNSYSFTLPTYPNFSPVSFYLLVEDSDGLVGRNPIAGTYNFFVADDVVTSIVQVQKTADESTGVSPLLGVGKIPVNISGIIVSDNSDGVIILQEAAAAWSGVFLEKTTATQALVKGDAITVTSTEVVEAVVSGSSSVGLTQLTKLEFTVNSSGNDVSTVIPTVATDDVVRMQAAGELEPYEGMLVKFAGVEIVDRGNYGEYTLRNTDADSTGGVIFNEDIRSDEVGAVSISYEINNTLREGITFDAYGIVAASFGAPKVHPRSEADFVGNDGNVFTPLLDFALSTPADSAEVIVNGDLEVSWGASFDLDGDDVTFEFVLYSADGTAVLATVPSNGASTATDVTLPFSLVDGLLASEGLTVGQNKSFLWNVRVSDGSDTLDVHGAYGNFGDDFSPIYRFITLERGSATSNEEIAGLPEKFSLNQNYPNPFNPTTNISFDLPNSATVTLEVFDMLGRKVATIVNEQLTAGTHNVSFDAARYASGMYIYRIQAGTFASTRKMMLIK